MPKIVIKKSTFKRLQHHANPLVDTTDTVINRALDALEQQNGGVVPQNDNEIPDLTHTKVTSAMVDGQKIEEPNWNKLFRKVLVLLAERVENIDELQKFCSVNLYRGRRSDKGYIPIRDIKKFDISVQGMNANNTCVVLESIARRLGIHLEVTIRWHQKPEAARPGEIARLKLPRAKK